MNTIARSHHKIKLTGENKHRLKHKKGHWVWVYDRWRTIYNEQNIPIRMIGTHTDISKEVYLHLEISKLNENLEKRIALATHDLKVSQKQAKLGSWKLDILKNILTWSDETYAIFELERISDIANYEDFLSAIHPEDKEKVNTAYI